MKFGKWEALRARPPFAARQNVPAFVQFSGGRTSGMMSALAPDDVVLLFENTGRENERTLEFVQRVGDALKREVVWLEWRPPPRRGDPPRMFSFERVDFRTACRHGEPFEGWMEAINAYRREKGEPYIVPHSMGRGCTAFLKVKVMKAYVRSVLGADAYDTWVGLRADEPDRVHRLTREQSANRRFVTPLHEAGITKRDVLEFWSSQDFDLELPEYGGNCDGCFLKDQADRSRALGQDLEATAWWQGMQDAWAGFGGAKQPPYSALAAELPLRLKIESTLREGRDPVNDGSVTATRFRLVVMQERRRIRSGATPFVCACENALGYDVSGEDDE